MYRIACTYHPEHQRLAGRASAGGHAAKRGVWRVVWWRAVAARENDAEGIHVVGTVQRVLWLPSAYHLRPGTLCNPRPILAEYQAYRRRERELVAMVNRVAFDITKATARALQQNT